MPAKLLRLTLLAALAVTTAAALAQTPTYTVTVLTDPATGTPAHCTNQALNGATPDASCALRDALAATDALAVTGTGTQPIINFKSSLTSSSNPQTLTLSAQLVAHANFNLSGPGASQLAISGNQNVPILLQANTGTTTSTVSGLALTSGVILNTTSTSGTIGGAAWASSGTASVTFLNDQIASNFTVAFNGGVSIEGGAIQATNVTLTGTNINGNAAINEATGTVNNLVQGGAIYASGLFTAGPSTLAGTTLSSNFAESAGIINGAAVSAAQFSITGTTFTGNFIETTSSNAVAYGGAASFSGSGSITNSIFYGNFIACNGYPGTSPLYLGGAIAFLGFGASVSSSSFVFNYTQMGVGGAIYGQSLTVQTSNFSFNGYASSTATTEGGAIAAGPLTLTTSVFAGNSSGGGTVIVGAPSTITNSLFNANNGNSAQSTGPALFLLSGATVTGTTFVGNNGGGVASDAQVSLYNVTTSGNGVGVVNLGSASSGTYAQFYNSAITDGVSAATNETGNYYCATSCTTALLSTLGNHGGPTVGAGTYTTTLQTMVPMPGSPLIGAAVNSAANLNGATTDQRGYSRSTTYGGTARVDIGAVQSNYSLTFSQQPSNTLTGSIISPSPAVLIGETGPSVSASGSPITLTASSGTLSGTTTQTTSSSNLATFSGLSIAPPETSETLIASLTLNPAIPLYLTTTSNPFVISGGSTAQTITFPQPRPGVANGSATITATTTSGLPVTFSITSGPATVGSTTTTGSGASTISSATITYTATGTVTIAANQPGNATYATAATVTNTVQVNANYIWLLNNTGTTTRTTNAAASPTTLGTPATPSTLGSLAFDASGNSWSVTLANNQLIETNAAATSMTTFTGNNLSNPAALAIDGSGLIWIANQGNNSLSLFSNTGTALNPSVEYAKDKITKPTSLVIDAAGGLWITSQGTNSITHLFGAATPVATPLSNATSNATLGTRP